MITQWYTASIWLKKQQQQIVHILGNCFCSPEKILHFYIIYEHMVWREFSVYI